MEHRDFRCPHCEKLLFKGALAVSEVEVRCRGCRRIVVFRGETGSEFLCMKTNCPNRACFALHAAERNTA